MKKFNLLLTFIVSLLAANVASADDVKDVFSHDAAVLEQNRQAFVKARMRFDGEQEKLFWALYQDYRKQVSKVNLQAFDVLREYADVFNEGAISDKEAGRLMKSFLSLEEKRFKVKKQHMKKFDKKLPTALVWRYFNIEDRLDTMVRHAYLQQIPMVPQTEE